MAAPQHHPIPGTGAALVQSPVRAGAVSLPVSGCGDMGGLWQYLPVVPGHHVHLWLLAAQPPEHPARGRQELIPIVTAHSSSQPCQVPPPAREHPTVPTTSLGAWRTGSSHVPPSRAGSAPSGGGGCRDTPQEKQPPTSHAIGLPLVLPCHPSGQGPLVCPKRKEEGEQATGGRQCQTLFRASLRLPAVPDTAAMPRPRGQGAAAGSLSACLTQQGGRGRAYTPGNAVAPYSRPALGAPQVLVVQRCHPCLESRSNPGREKAGSGQGL